MEEEGTSGLDRGADAPDRVRGQIVDHDDVALRPPCGQHRLDLDPEGFAFPRSIEIEACE